MADETRADRIRQAADAYRAAMYAEAKLDPEDQEYMRGFTLVGRVNRADKLYVQATDPTKE